MGQILYISSNIRNIFILHYSMARGNPSQQNIAGGPIGELSNMKCRCFCLRVRDYGVMVWVGFRVRVMVCGVLGSETG